MSRKRGTRIEGEHPLLVTGRALEVVLKYALGGNRVDSRLDSGAARAGSAQQALRFMGGQMLVNELGADSEAAPQTLREAAGEAANGMFGTVDMRGEPDNQQRRSPFLYEH